MKNAVARVLAIVSGALAAYVLYAHLSSCRTTREYSEEPITIAFTDASWRTQLEVRVEKGVTVTVEGGRLRVRGDAPDAAFEVAGPVRRLRDVAIHARLRAAKENAAYDVGVGLERADGSTRVTWGLHDEKDHPAWRFSGDERAAFPPAAEGLERQRYAPFADADRAHDHDVSLRVSPDLHALLGAVDGVPTSSHVAGWDDGVAVRPVLSLRARAPGGAFDVEIADFAYEPMARVHEDRPERIVEHFEGAILDPRTWRVLPADEFAASGKMTLAKGLRLEGKALRPMREEQAILLVGPTVALGSFHAAIKFTARVFHRARFFFGVSNLLFGLSDWRNFDVGIADGLTQTEPYAAGHWEGDGQFSLAPFPGPLSGVKDGEIAIDYDASSGVARATLNGKLVTMQRLDFQPPEPVHIHFGGRVATSEGAFDVKVSEVRFEPGTWKATGEIAAHAVAPKPLDAASPAFFDDFMTDSMSKYHVIDGVAAWEAAGKDLKLGPGPGGYNEIVRGTFDQPVTVTGSIFVPEARGEYDSAGVMATDRSADTRWLSVIWYGTKLLPELHITKQVAGKGDQFVGQAPIKLTPGRSYWVKMLVDRRNVYAKAWPNEKDAVAPDHWMTSASLDDGWTATGGVGFAANAAGAWVGALRAE